jgi:type IV secretion system protein VirB11
MEGRAQYLDIYLAPLAQWLARNDVTDVMINRPGEAWIETLGGTIERVECPELDAGRLWHLVRQVAALSHQGISRAHPLLAATLPDGARVQVVAPPATRGDMAIAFRKHLAPKRSLHDYVADGAFCDAAVSSGIAAPAPSPRPSGDTQEDLSRFLSELVGSRRNVLISGGTSSGKTTFLNALMREIPPRERIVLIEDTAEIALAHGNAIGLLATMGELRGAEAYTFLRAINTGHPGSLSTIHADSPEGAIEQLALIILQTGTQLRREDIVAYVTATVDVIVQLERRNGVRRIAAIKLTRD